MTLCYLTDIDLYKKIHYAIWGLLGYICSCFLHTLDRLVHGYILLRFCTLPRKSRRFIAREQKLVYSNHDACCVSYFFRLFLFSSLLYCSWAVYCMAAYGIILAIVAELPLHRNMKPSCFHVWMINLTASFPENALLETESRRQITFHILFYVHSL